MEYEEYSFFFLQLFFVLFTDVSICLFDHKNIIEFDATFIYSFSYHMVVTQLEPVHLIIVSRHEMGKKNKLMNTKKQTINSGRHSLYKKRFYVGRY